MPQHRDGRTTDTRQLILKEAEKLYYVGGYERISLQVIADHLEISKAALFHHFKNKRELFFEMLLMILEHMREMLESNMNKEGITIREKLYLVMQRLAKEERFDMMRFQREEYGLLDSTQQHAVNVQWHTDMFDIVQGVFKEGIEQGALRPHDTTLSAYLFLSMCLLLPNTAHPIIEGVEMEQLGRDEYIHKLLNMLLEGLNKK